MLNFLMVVLFKKTNKNRHEYIAIFSYKNLETLDTPKEYVPNIKLEELKTGLDCRDSTTDSY